LRREAPRGEGTGVGEVPVRGDGADGGESLGRRGDGRGGHERDRSLVVAGKRDGGGRVARVWRWSFMSQCPMWDPRYCSMASNARPQFFPLGRARGRILFIILFGVSAALGGLLSVWTQPSGVTGGFLTAPIFPVGFW
jgi:hypothetical protein